ncbi:hypothetical protein K469DRAFT_691976 [Zopfia rhizophila CBS 207.26]|uniref:Uncharacterized protein n=1 Tax=Zopfia rhizophila CBS 207.26 TaxID=1314779 RepID=A0A6A6DSX6_9PEZI|nr:hypothetical protein K469DRAFT_691976 [Zopfia rhizophila CBS 207.26]
MAHSLSHSCVIGFLACVALLLSQPQQLVSTAIRPRDSIVQFCDAAPQTRSTEQVTPPSSFINPPLTPPPTDKKPFAQARRVIALFKDIQAGKNTKQDPWAEFQLVPGDYDEIERLLSHDKALSGFVKDKLRHDHDRENHRLVVRMPTGVHELFIDGVEDTIRSQLKAIRSGSGKAASFAQKVRPARSTNNAV